MCDTYVCLMGGAWEIIGWQHDMRGLEGGRIYPSLRWRDDGRMHGWLDGCMTCSSNVLVQPHKSSHACYCRLTQATKIWQQLLIGQCVSPVSQTEGTPCIAFGMCSRCYSVIPCCQVSRVSRLLACFLCRSHGNGKRMVEISGGMRADTVTVAEAREAREDITRGKT